MADKNNGEPFPVTVWLNAETLEVLNKLVLASSSKKKVANRTQVIRQLIETAGKKRGW